MSTMRFPCNHSGFFSPQQAAMYGLVSIDFENTMDGKHTRKSNALRHGGALIHLRFFSDWAFAKPTDQESRSLRQAEMIKAINPESKVFVYR